MVLLTDSYLGDVVAMIATITTVVYAYFKWNYQYWKRRNVPYFEPSIPFGNLPNPLTSGTAIPDYIGKLYVDAKAKGWKYCGIYFVTSPTIMVMDLDLLKKVMTKDFTNFVDRGVYVNEKDDPLSCQLFSLGGIRWKNLRAKLSPTFTSGKMKMMFHIITQCGTIFEKYIDENIANREVVDIMEILARFSTDVIGSCAFGLECNSFNDADAPFRVYGRKVFHISTFTFAKILLATNFPKTANALGVRQLQKDVSDFYMNVVKDTVSYRRNNNVTRNDFLQLLMELLREDGSETKGDGNTLTMNELAAECFAFFMPGFKMSSTIMTFALFELATHPEMQDKVREEIRTVLAKHDNKITYDSMNELVYMNQIIDETLRMYPPVPILTRVCNKDYTIPGDNVVIEKGTTIFIPVMGYHYDEEYYPNSKIFDPERFSVENKKNRDKFTHLPFGGGPRICIGERFGIMQTKVGLTSVLNNFHLFLDKRTKVPLKIDPKSQVIAAEGGIWLQVKTIQ